MKPYASGKEHYELSKFQDGWLDRDPITNGNVWYAVTVVTRNGDEWKKVNPAKVCVIWKLFYFFDSFVSYQLLLSYYLFAECFLV